MIGSKIQNLTSLFKSGGKQSSVAKEEIVTATQKQEISGEPDPKPKRK